MQGGTVVKPLTGLYDDGPSDAAVLKPIGTKGPHAIALANGINPEYGKLDAYHMAWSVVDEAIRNAVAVGADPARIALLDNFCWGDPKRPETLGALVEAAEAVTMPPFYTRFPLSPERFAQQRVPGQRQPAVGAPIRPDVTIARMYPSADPSLRPSNLFYWIAR